MHQSFRELRERLLRAGVAPRHVRRYLNELADHFDDLTAEEERGGSSREDAESAALSRLGGIDALAKAMIEQRRFQSSLRAWCVRAPWAMFGLAPLCLLAVAYVIACLILWFGWKIFLPGSDTPFVRINGLGTREELAIFYFQLGRLFYFAAPLLIGWGIEVVAARQRLKAVWPTAGLVLIAWMGGSAQVHASRTGVPGGFGHIRMDFALWPSVQGNLFHAVVILSLTVLPYLIWQLQ
ncbi:MAG: permease prefix domain 1-containing protein, partial [Terriglobales bacterium]